MLCSMCQHGTTNFWTCVCGDTHCNHIQRCQCGHVRTGPGPIHVLLLKYARTIVDGWRQKNPDKITDPIDINDLLNYALMFPGSKVERYSPSGDVQLTVPEDKGQMFLAHIREYLHQSYL
jgi:hypothetical protein